MKRTQVCRPALCGWRLRRGSRRRGDIPAPREGWSSSAEPISGTARARFFRQRRRPPLAL